jgi:hypothetical protein
MKGWEKAINRLYNPGARFAKAFRDRAGYSSSLELLLIKNRTFPEVASRAAFFPEIRKIGHFCFGSAKSIQHDLPP